jgi:ABC-type lipoprotein release transport system permease subunit
MTAPVGTNRKMFWRIIRRLLFAHRGRLFVILLALGTGAAVTAALLNLQVDAKRRLTTEFRVLGANVMIAPRDPNWGAGSSATLDEAIVQQVPQESEGGKVAIVSFLYVVANVATDKEHKPFQAVIAGVKGGALGTVMPFQEISRAASIPVDMDHLVCAIGTKIANQLPVNVMSHILLQIQAREVVCPVAEVFAFGGPGDNQVFLRLDGVQRLANLPGRISLVQLGVPGTPRAIDRYISSLMKVIPDADVHGIRQFTEAEAKIYDRISGLLTATVALVLLLTGLCVMAAMTNVAMERRNDVGLMKAIGGASRRVLWLFLAEAALLGLTGGLLGAAGGIALSIALGKAVFGVAARPRLIVYPVTVALTIIVSIAGAFPLRRLTSIRPASVFRGEA